MWPPRRVRLALRGYRPFLRQAFHRFSNDDLVAFFEGLGVPTVVERGGRIFPASGRAYDVVDALTQWMRVQGVTVHSGVSVEGP
jgi:predicted flavoprotein YhiN